MQLQLQVEARQVDMYVAVSMCQMALEYKHISWRVIYRIIVVVTASSANADASAEDDAKHGPCNSCPQHLKENRKKK